METQSFQTPRRHSPRPQRPRALDYFACGLCAYDRTKRRHSHLGMIARTRGLATWRRRLAGSREMVAGTPSWHCCPVNGFHGNMKIVRANQFWTLRDYLKRYRLLIGFAWMFTIRLDLHFANTSSEATILPQIESSKWVGRDQQ